MSRVLKSNLLLELARPLAVDLVVGVEPCPGDLYRYLNPVRREGWLCRDWCLLYKLDTTRAFAASPSIDAGRANKTDGRTCSPPHPWPYPDKCCIQSSQHQARSRLPHRSHRDRTPKSPGIFFIDKFSAKRNTRVHTKDTLTQIHTKPIC